MGRASFGGQADYSYVFANLYNQAASERKAQIDQAMNDAKRVAQAEDDRLIAAWNKGTVSDKELMARLEMRRDEASDPADQAAFTSLIGEYKDLIADGKAELKFKGNDAGLMAYYESKAKGLNKDSAGYRRAMLKVAELKAKITPASDGRKNNPSDLDKIDTFVGDETDMKLLFIKAYEGGMGTWPPSTANGLTQSEVDVLMSVQSTYDFPGGNITSDYIDQLDSEILGAIDTAVAAAAPGAKAKYLQSRSKYLADHVTLHNDLQQTDILLGTDGVLQTATKALNDARLGVTDPAKLAAAFKVFKDTLKSHFAAAGQAGVTDKNKSGGATSNEYQVLGSKIDAILDEVASGKTPMTSAFGLIKAVVAGMPDYKDNWVKGTFSDQVIQDMLGYGPNGTIAGNDTGFKIYGYLADGYAGAKKEPPTRAMVFNDDGIAFTGVTKTTKYVNGQPTVSYEPNLTQPAANQAWTMVSMDIDGHPTLVPALATLKVTGVPQYVVDAKGVKIDRDKIAEVYKTQGAGALHFAPQYSVYEVTVGTGKDAKSYSYVGGTIGPDGVARGGTWFPTSKLNLVWGSSSNNQFDTGGPLDKLLANNNVRFLNDENKPFASTIPGEPLPYFGNNAYEFQGIIRGTKVTPGGLKILDEYQKSGIGTDADGKIDYVFDPAQIDVWVKSYDPKVTGMGGKSFNQSIGTGLASEERWKEATQGKVDNAYNKPYDPYAFLSSSQDQRPKDPISAVMGISPEPENIRYAPNVGPDAFNPSALNDYVHMSSERDKAMLPKINMADTWDRGIKTATPPSTPPSPTPPINPTPPTPPSATPPLGPRGTAGPRAI